MIKKPITYKVAVVSLAEPFNKSNLDWIDITDAMLMYQTPDGYFDFKTTTEGYFEFKVNTSFISEKILNDAWRMCNHNNINVAFNKPIALCKQINKYSTIFLIENVTCRTSRFHSNIVRVSGKLVNRLYYGTGKPINMEKNMYYASYMPGITKVIVNDPAVIVFWKDDTKTVSKCMPGETFNPEIGLSMCISKKYYECSGFENPRASFKRQLKTAKIIEKKK